MPVESASYINQLVPTNPEDSDIAFQGAQQIRLVKSVLQQTFPQFNGAMTVASGALNNVASWFFTNTTANGVTVATTAALPNQSISLASNTGSTLTLTNIGTGITIQSGGTQIANISTSGLNLGTMSITANQFSLNGVNVVPSGTVVMWWGSIASIPAGWALCNGQNGTPDMRGYFPIGAGGSYNPGQYGGQSQYTTTTDTQGYHDHSMYTGTFGAVNLSGTTDQQGTHNHGGGTGLAALTPDQLPPHTHGYLGIGSGGAIPGGSGYGTISEQTDGGSGLAGNPHNHSISLDGLHSHNLNISQYPAHNHQIYYDGSHFHNITTQALPPFVSLAFIMKL